jgi:hypothetical protein
MKKYVVKRIFNYDKRKVYRKILLAEVEPAAKELAYYGWSNPENFYKYKIIEHPDISGVAERNKFCSNYLTALIYKLCKVCVP